MSKHAPNRDPEEMSPRDLPAPAELADDLRKIAKVGTSPGQMTGLNALEQLSLVQVAAPGTNDTDIALAIAKVVNQVASELGEGPHAKATRLFFGLDEASKGLRLEDRRFHAADMIGVSVETWRRNWEHHSIDTVALEIYRQETEARIVVHVRPGKRRSDTALADLATGTGGKDLQRREDESRLFASAYLLRAEVFRCRRLAASHDEEATVEQQAITALRIFTTFSDNFAEFITNYGTGIVMAGNEVTAREAASLLGFRPSIEDEDISFLRMVAADKTTDNADFMSALDERDPQRTGRILGRWITSISG